MKANRDGDEFPYIERESVNMGIAIVTPIEDVMTVIERDETLITRRRKLVETEAQKRAPTLDIDSMPDY